MSRLGRLGSAGLTGLSLLLMIAGGTPPAQAVEDQSPDQQTQQQLQTLSAEDREFFEQQVRPLLIDQCYECHAGAELSGGLSLESREQLLAGGDSGPALQPMAPDESLLIEAISYRNEHLQMPPKGRLNEAQIAVLRTWISRGAPDPRAPPSPSQVARPQVGLSLDEGRQFWSFQPVADPPLPSVRGADWLRTPIDAFVLQRLEDLGLEPAPRADRRTLIRRLTLDLTGLPPTAEEVEQFEADPSELAYGELVERLLASPQYGVRWGRHWLDVARYADSTAWMKISPWQRVLSRLCGGRL